MRMLQYSSLIFIFSMISQIFLPFDSQIFSMIFSTISLISGINFSWKDSSINFIQFMAYSEVFVTFFQESTSLRMGITFMKFMGQSLYIFITAYISTSLDWMLSLRTSYYSLDISNRIGSRIQSNLSLTILLKQFLAFALVFFLRICQRKKLKMSCSHFKVWNLVQLDDLLFATLTKIVTISLIQSISTIFSKLPSWNFSLRIVQKMNKQLETSASSSFSLIMRSKSSKKSGKQMYRSSSMIYLIQPRRNFLTQKFMVFIFNFKMLTNSGKLSYSVSLSTFKTMFFRVLFRNLHDSLTVSSTSLMQQIIFQKMRLKSRSTLWFKMRVIQNKALIATNLILDQLSLRQRKMHETIFASYILRDLWSF